MNLRNFFAELKRRNVYKVAVAYVVAGWALAQGIAQVFPVFDIPNWAVRLIVLAIVIGFPVALVIAWAFELTPEGIKRTEDVDLAASARQPRKHAWIFVVIVGAALSIGLFFIGRYTARNSSSASPSELPAKSIAVLPFANLSRDADNAFFADGMQDEILTKLSKIGALRVISRASTQRYASAPENLAEIARQLGVANILEGSVQKAGNAVHINVQLIGAAKDEHLWAESYNRTLDDIFGVEGEVAQAVAEALKATLTGAERRVVSAKGTENPRAYEAYLRGRATDNGAYSYIGTARAVDNYFEAVREDPKFAQAWSAAAVAMSNFYFNGYDVERSTADAVRNAADTAMKLQPQLAESLLARGAYLYRVQRDYPAAIEIYKQALAQQPGDVDIISELFFVERRMGRWDESIAHYREAIARDPRNVSIRVQGACEIFFRLRRFDETRELLEQALKIAPDDTTARAGLAQIELQLGRLDAADAWLARVPSDLREYYEADARMLLLMLRRDYAALAVFMRPAEQRADAALSGGDILGLLRLGFVQRATGHADLARKTFERLAGALATVPGGIDHVTAIGPISPLVYAGLGDWTRAIAAAHHQIEINRNGTLESAAAKIAVAQIYAQKGDRDAAIALLPELLEIPSGVTPALLALDPIWDPIREDPRFVALTKQPMTEYKVSPR